MEAQATVPATPQPPQGPVPWYIAATDILVKLLKEIGMGGTIILFACALFAYGVVEAGKFAAPLLAQQTATLALIAQQLTENGHKLDKLNEQLLTQSERNRDLIREAKAAAERAELAAIRDKR